MGLAHSPSIVMNGLVFYYDMNNYQKSWAGQPTTNLVGDGMSIYNNVPGDVTATLATTGEYYRGAPIYKLTLTPTTASGVSYLTAGNNPGIGVVSGGGGGLANRYTGHSIFFRPTVPMHSSPIYTHYSNIAGWQSSTNYYSMNDGWLRAHVIWYDTVTRSDGKYWAINPASATLNVPIIIYWAGPFKEDRNDSVVVSPYVYNSRYANSNLESSPSYPSWNTNGGSSYSGGTLTFVASNSYDTHAWDFYKTYSGLSTGTNYTWSALVKLGTASNLIITMNNTSSWNTGPSTVVAGLSSTDWTRISITGTTNTGSFNLHLGSSANSEVYSKPQSGGTVFIQDVRLVLSQSQTAISDMMDKNTINASSLTYNNDGTFSFNGSNSLTISANPTSFNFNNEQTIIIWMTNKSTSATRRNPYNQAYAGGGTITHENDTGFNYFYGTGGGDNSPYTSLYSSFSVIQGERAMIALTRNTSTTSWYKNGVFSNSHGNPYGAVVTGSNAITIGSGYTTGFVGEIHSVSLYDRCLSANEILQNYAALRERYFGYQPMTYIASGNMTLTNNGTEAVSMFKTSGNYSWDNQVYSLEMFTAPCTIEFSKQAAFGDNGQSYAMIGWNTDPTTDASYGSLDYAAYPYNKNDYVIYNNGSGQGGLGVWDSDKRFYIVYDTDGYIRHYNGNKLLYSVNYGTGNKVYVDSSYYSVDSTYCGFSNVKVSRRSWNGYTYV